MMRRKRKENGTERSQQLACCTIVRNLNKRASKKEREQAKDFLHIIAEVGRRFVCTFH